MEEKDVISEQNSSTPTSVFPRDVLDSAFRFEDEFNAQFMDEFALNAPLCTHLDQCLSLYTKEILIQIGDDHSLELKNSMKKETMVQKLRQKIIQNFHSVLPYLPTRNLEFLRAFTHENGYTVDADVFLFPDFTHLHHFGFLFLFKREKGYSLVLPRELSPFLGILRNEDLFVKSHLHQRLDAYATTLANLYGIVDIDQFAILWNKYEQETFTPAMIEDELKELNRTQIFWWFMDEFVISTYFSTPEEVEEYLESIRDVAYYMPSVEELRQYYITPYEKSSPAVDAMSDFLSALCGEGEEALTVLMQDLNDAIVVGEKMENVFELLGEYGVIFHGIDELNTFNELYGDMDETIRKWQLKGHRPAILKNRNHSHHNSV